MSKINELLIPQSPTNFFQTLHPSMNHRRVTPDYITEQNDNCINTQKQRQKKPVRRTKRLSQDKGEFVDVDGDGDRKDQDIPRSPEVKLKTMVDHNQTVR